jgi:hypothetical protein
METWDVEVSSRNLGIWVVIRDCREVLDKQDEGSLNSRRLVGKL